MKRENFVLIRQRKGRVVMVVIYCLKIVDTSSETNLVRFVTIANRRSPGRFWRGRQEMKPEDVKKRIANAHWELIGWIPRSRVASSNPRYSASPATACGAYLRLQCGVITTVIIQPL